MQVGDALVGVNHRQLWTNGVDRFDVSLDFRLFLGRQGADALVKVADAVVQAEADLLQRVSVLGQCILVELIDDLTEHDRVGDLHHGGFQMHREQNALLAGVFDLGGNEAAQGFGAHDRAVNDFASLDGSFFLQNGGGAVLSDQFDLDGVIGCDLGSFFAAVEVAVAHVRNVGLGVGSPRAHFVWVLARVILDRQRGTAIGVAFAQHRVHGAALGLVVTCAGFFFRVSGRFFRVVGNLVALILKLLDGRLQLRDRGADVRQLDDVGFWRSGQFAQLGEMIRHLLIGAKRLREAGKNTARQRDVARFHVDIGGGCESFDDRQQRVGGEGRSFVGEGVDDLRAVGHSY
ncbi:hypothetical protein ALP75_201126 [Pseudomonas syringae pv. actinidiae]|nr:hypothetical protein ALP75_201126 [Pseudomonas syringae pv. actinidiae]